MTSFSYQLRETLLSVQGVSLKLGDNPILHNVNATVKNIVRPGLTQGQVIGFLGPSGRGKTQLSRILAGLQEPTAGAVLITEKQTPVERGVMGMVMQHYPLLDHRTVWENVYLAGKLSGMEAATARARALELLERFKLIDRREHYPAQLSGGQRQRVAIVQQILSSDNFLIMDEPFSGLDPIMKDEVCHLINQVATTNELFTVIVITHDIAAAVSVSDTLWMLGFDRDANGAVIPHGSSIQATYDLIERGLAWQPNVQELPDFAACVREVTAKFRQL